ncbi:MAG: oligosaccharide flippase family protein, partial [Candidatus Baltobacteraceae bacterium]
MNGSVSPPGIVMLRRGLERLRTSAMLKQGMLVFTASMVLNLCGFIAHAVASRQLGVAVYGGLYALINAAVIAALPVAFIAPVVAQLAAEFRALHDDGHLRGLTDSVAGGFAKLAFVYLIVAVLGALPFARFLHVPVWSVPFVGLLAGVTLFVSALRAIAQGTQDFGGYALSNAVEGVAKVLGIGILVAIGLKLFGGIFGFFLGPLCALIYLAIRLTRRYAASPPQRVRYDWRRIVNAGAGAAAATMATALMGSADVVLVKHFFDPHEAGLYAAASLGGKMLLYLVGFVPTVLLPQAADRHARGAQTREVLMGSLLMFAVVAFCGLSIFHFFGTQVLHALVGHAFDAALPLLATYGLAMVLLALTNALTYYG